MNSPPETIPIQRYIRIDIHKHYLMVGCQNANQEWVLRPRQVQMVHFRSWAGKNLKEGDAVVVEATGSVWDIYDIVDPLVSKTVVANAHKVRQIAEARVKTDKEDIKRLITLLIADIVPDVWVPPMHVRELRSLISFRWRLSKQITSQEAGWLCWSGSRGTYQRREIPGEIDHQSRTQGITLGTGGSCLGSGPI
jgi:transposase